MRSDTIGNLAKALSTAQSNLSAAEFDSVNPFLKNHYASLGAVIKAIQPQLKANGLCFTQLPTNDGSSISVETILMHESGEWVGSILSMPLGDEKGKSLAQSAGGIITYLRRYALSAIFGVYAEEDEDGADKKAQAAKKEAPKAEEKKVEPPPPDGDQHRPYPPERVKVGIESLTKKFEGQVATPIDRNMIAVNLEKCFAPDPNSQDMRHSVVRYLTGCLSTKDLTDAQVLALKKWVDAKPSLDGSGEWVANHYTMLEAQSIYKAALVDEGQASLL